MNVSEWLTRGTALVAVFLYLLRVLMDLAGGCSEEKKRTVWTLGCMMMWLHIAVAFHFVHDWSHAHAVAATAEQTRQLTGWAWGGGVYINDLFATFWLVDVIRWAKWGPASKLWFWTMHAIFGFMMFNATVVFGPKYWRYLAGIAILAAVLIWRNRRSVFHSNKS